MKKLIAYIFIIGFPISIWSCEDVIDLEIKDGVTQLVVDAWLTDKPEPQVIKLTLSQPYFDNSAPQPALGATVTVFESDSTAHSFVDVLNDGNYVLQGEPFLQVDALYALYIAYDGQEYVSISSQKRVPKIDSISFENFTFPVSPPDGGPQKGFLGQFYAKDFDGQNDTYWIRTTKNDTLINNPSNLSIAYDASFSPGAGSDGLLFILPIRQSINDGLYRHGDKTKVELWSITNEAYYYLFQIRQESANGGIFATPPANIPTNIVNRDENSKVKAVGFFGISSVSSIEAVVDSVKAKPER